MTRSLKTVLSTAILSAALGAAALTAPVAVAAPASATEEREVLRLVNAERSKVGCPSVRASSQLTNSARAHSTDMARNDYFSHTGRDGSSPFDRMRRAGYSGSRMAENIAAGYQTPSEVMQGWMNSDGHRANILNCNYRDLGVGVARGGTYGIYWTQNFGG